MNKAVRMFEDELVRLVNRSVAESDLTVGEALGVMEVMKYRLLRQLESDVEMGQSEDKDTFR